MSNKLHTEGHLILNEMNEEVMLLGWGHGGGDDSPVGDWWGAGSRWKQGEETETDFTVLTSYIDATLDAMKVHKGNIVRELFIPDWWNRETINMADYGLGSGIVNYRDYLELVAQRVNLKDMYVDFTPYGFWSYPDGSGGNFNTMTLEQWKTFWTEIVNKLGSYSCVIFEPWNEVGINKDQWFSYLIEFYKTVRSLGNNNLVTMQWRSDAVPNYQEELTWIPDLHNQLRTAIGFEPVNVVYTWHAYRYTWNYSWGTDYSTILSQITSSNWIPCTRTANVDVPVIMNEGGPGMNLTGSALNTELNWWDGILKACLNQGVGFIAFYWLDRVGWSPDQALLEDWPVGQPAPNLSVAGQMVIDAWEGVVTPQKHRLTITSDQTNVPVKIRRVV